jgi:thiopurine S-methyltransferase
MELEFWHDKWDRNEIGFHLDAPHPWFERAIKDLHITPEQTVFVPLCGKTHDIDLLLQHGCQIVANELSELAVKELFSRLGLTPNITNWLEGKLYQTPRLTVYAGDFFKLKPSDLASVYQTQIDWIYDRAALVALPLDMRKQYSAALSHLCPQANQMLMTLDYDQSLMQGPPFSVSQDEVTQHYDEAYNIEVIHQQDIIDKEPRFKQRGLTAFHQRLYRLMPLSKG